MTEIEIRLIIITFTVFIPISTIMYFLGYCVGRKIERESRENEIHSRD